MVFLLTSPRLFKAGRCQINPNTWFGEIPFTESSGKAIAYKYALWREKDLPLYEKTISRRWILAERGIVKLRSCTKKN